MAANEIHVGDIGTIFRATIKENDVALDISNATARVLIFEKDDGTVVSKDASFTTDGADGDIEYETVDENDLNVAGSWKVQGRVTTPEGRWSSDIYSFTVYENLD